MKGRKKIICTVTNDLVYDQRMIRICTSLAGSGYSVLLVGRCYRHSPPLVSQPFEQHRIHCLFQKGKRFYIEYNLRLFLWLVFQKAQLLCAIDLDTILPVLFVSRLKGSQRVYDAHELFCEMKEVVSRPAVYRFWKNVERLAVPRFRAGYTVSEPIREVLAKDYGVAYEVVRNMPLLKKPQQETLRQPFILYQGAVNEGRSFETLIPAFQWIEMPLHIYGDGNYLAQAKTLVHQLGLSKKVLFKGKLIPEQLRVISSQACMGITLFENRGLSNYFSLANRFFDYIHAGLPQLCVDYPVYRAINTQYEVGELISDLSAENIARTINALLADGAKLQTLRSNCLKAREYFNWQAEEKRLIQFYNTLLG